MGRAVAAALASLACAGLALDASAHAPPLAARVLAAGAGEELIVTNRGLVFRELATGEARLLCNEALRVSTAELPNVAFAAGGGLIVASSGGLRQTRDRGCTWSDVGGMQNANTPALAQDPNDPHTLFVARYDGDSPGVSSSRDAGASWRLVLATPPEDYVRSLLVAADSRSVYATLTTFAAGRSPSHALLRSRDGGSSWQRLPLPLLVTDNAAFVAAASPADPDRLALYTIGNSPGLDHGRLLSSRDAGDTFVVSLELPEIRAASFSQDGRLWVAARDGLYVAREVPEPGGVSDAAAEAGGDFERVSDATELGCVQERNGALLVCGHYAGATAGSGIGVLEVPGQRFESLLDFEDVAAPVSCPDDSLVAALCAAPWRDWQAELLGVSSSGSGLAPAGAGGSAGAGPSSAGSREPGPGSPPESAAASPPASASAGPATACTVAAGAAPRPAWLLALVLGLLGLRRTSPEASRVIFFSAPVGRPRLAAASCRPGLVAWAWAALDRAMVWLTRRAVGFALGLVLVAGVGLLALVGGGRCGVPTTLFIVRHADRAGRDDALAPAGTARAVALGQVLAKEPLAAIYHSDTRRTRETAAPLASLLGLTPIERPATAVGALVSEIFAEHRGQRVLVVAHSNTAVQIIQAAGGPSLANIGEDEFDNLFVLNVCDCLGKRATLLQLQYGAASP